MTPAISPVAALNADHANLMFSDVHTRGRYPGDARRHFRENGIELNVTDDDRSLLAEHAPATYWSTSTTGLLCWTTTGSLT